VTWGSWWVSTLAYPNLLGTERLCCCCCVVVVVIIFQSKKMQAKRSSETNQDFSLA